MFTVGDTVAALQPPWRAAACSGCLTVAAVWRMQGRVDLSFLETGELPAGGLNDAQFDALVDTVAGTPVKVDVVMKVMGLWHTRDTVVGNELLRGVSGGERHRITTAEMLVGPRRILMMDEISTGTAPATSAPASAPAPHLPALNANVKRQVSVQRQLPCLDTCGDVLSGQLPVPASIPCTVLASDSSARER